MTICIVYKMNLRTATQEQNYAVDFFEQPKNIIILDSLKSGSVDSLQ